MNKTMLNPGDRVVHPAKPDWGVGKVLSATSSGVEVFFVNAGHKKLSPQYVTLTVVTGDQANHPLLDNLASAASREGTTFIALPDAIQKFLTEYPGGFAGERYFAEERGFKNKAHEACMALLGEGDIAGLLSAGQYAEICERARRVESTTNLLASFEKIQFNDALKAPENQRLFAEQLADNLYGTAEEKVRFERLATVLNQLQVAKWPVVTYFGYIRFPESRIFIKPEVTRNAAAVCGWEISYKPELNWTTYAGVRGLFEHLRSELVKAGLAPRDMIDVQSFVWCIAPPSVQNVSKTKAARLPTSKKGSPPDNTFKNTMEAMDEAAETVSHIGELRDEGALPELWEYPDDESELPDGVEIILQVGAEGGDLSLYGRRTPSGWEFMREVVDQTAAMLDEPTIQHQSETVTTVAEALCLLDRYPWHRLYPLKVHPEFRVLILEAAHARITKEGGSALRGLERWERVCRRSGNA